MKLQLDKVFVVSKYTLRELIKSRILVVTTVLSFATATFSIMAAEFTYGARARVALDFGVGLASLICIGIAIFMGNGLMFKEIENRTLYMVLSRPISRVSFLQGRVIGLLVFLLMNATIMILPSLGVFKLFGGSFESLFLWAIVFIMLETLIVTNVSILFSLFSTQALSAVFALAFYLSSHALTSEAFIAFASKKPVFKSVQVIFGSFLPNLSGMNLKEHLLYQASVPLDTLVKLGVHGILYLIAIMIINNIIFSKKNLN